MTSFVIPPITHAIPTKTKNKIAARHISIGLGMIMWGVTSPLIGILTQTINTPSTMPSNRLRHGSNSPFTSLKEEVFWLNFNPSPEPLLNTYSLASLLRGSTHWLSTRALKAIGFREYLVWPFGSWKLSIR